MIELPATASQSVDCAHEALRVLHAVSVRPLVDLDRSGVFLHELDEAQLLILQAMALAVDQYRVNGFTWAEIGDFIGITRQAAWERWGKRK